MTSTSYESDVQLVRGGAAALPIAPPTETAPSTNIATPPSASTAATHLENLASSSSEEGSMTVALNEGNTDTEATHIHTPSTSSVEGLDPLSFTTDVIPEGMTPHQWKIALRKQRRQMRKEQAMIHRKEKDRMKREQRKLEKKKRAEERKQRTEEMNEEQPPTMPKAKRKKMSDSAASSLRVAVDLDYTELMSVRDMKKVMHQCQRCYSENRRAATPLQLYFTSFSSRVMEVWDEQFPDYRHWDVHRREKDFVTLFGKENIVFLTSDSPNILQELDVSKAYIIGGLVDHNHHKGYCYKKALELGVEHAQLPIGQYVKLNSRTVLAINHVFEILLEFSQSKNWEAAFNRAIPPRKMAAKEESTTAADSNGTGTSSDNAGTQETVQKS